MGARISRSQELSLRVVLDEAVIRRQVGGPKVMRDQLLHLLSASRRPNVALQVLPFAASGEVTAGSGSFIVLDLVDGHAVYFEHLTTALYLEKPNEVDQYSKMFTRFQRSALSPKQTRDLIKEAADAF